MSTTAVTEKKFFASAVFTATGCSSDTFRSWRNRNGLFPETQGSGKWNKFSIIDVFVVGIVVELTSRGLAAQTAVDAAMAAAPFLSELCNIQLPHQDRDNIEEAYLEISGRLISKNSVLCISAPSGKGRPPAVSLLSFDDGIRAGLQEYGAAIFLDVRRLILVIGQMHLNDVEFENDRGERAVSIGAWPKQQSAKLPSSPSKKPVRRNARRG